jgi:hypothetical protein
VVIGAIVVVWEARKHVADDAPADGWPSSGPVLASCIAALGVSFAGGLLVFRGTPSWVAVLWWSFGASTAIWACGFAVPYVMSETGRTAAPE